MGPRHGVGGLYLFSSVCQSISTNKCKECGSGAIKYAARPKGGEWVGVSRVGLSHPCHDHEKNSEHMYHCDNCTATHSLLEVRTYAWESMANIFRSTANIHMHNPGGIVSHMPGSSCRHAVVCAAW